MNTSRRSFLGTLATGTAAAGLSACQSLRPNIPVNIDAHVHVWTPDTVRYPLAPGRSAADMVPPSFTPSELFELCRPESVGRVVLIQMSFYGTDNRYMLDMIRAYEGTFSGVAIIDENAPGVPSLMKDLASQGVRGFRLYSNRQRTTTWKDSDGMKRMWKAAASQNLAMCCLADPDALPDIDAMCQAHPETPVVIDHFARIGMRGPVNPDDLKRLTDMARHPRVHVKTSAFYALGEKKPPYEDLGPLIRALRDAYGADRLMWASDCPYQAMEGHTYAASIALIRDRLDFLSPSDRAAMLHGTAARLFFDA